MVLVAECCVILMMLCISLYSSCDFHTDRLNTKNGEAKRQPLQPASVPTTAFATPSSVHVTPTAMVTEDGTPEQRAQWQHQRKATLMQQETRSKTLLIKKSLLEQAKQESRCGPISAEENLQHQLPRLVQQLEGGTHVVRRTGVYAWNGDGEESVVVSLCALDEHVLFLIVKPLTLLSFSSFDSL